MNENLILISGQEFLCSAGQMLMILIWSLPPRTVVSLGLVGAHVGLVNQKSISREPPASGLIVFKLPHNSDLNTEISPIAEHFATHILCLVHAVVLQTQMGYCKQWKRNGIVPCCQLYGGCPPVKMHYGKANSWVLAK